LAARDRQPKVRAAGGAVRRPRDGTGELEIALVHRPKYDDWSLPKGKLEKGESFEEAALREVEEETGMRASLGDELGEARYRDAKGRSKLVRYWLMTPLGGRFEPHQEVDELAWLTPEEAMGRLTYEFDRELVRKLDGGTPERRNPPLEELYARKWPIFLVTMIGLFMALIDVTIVNITIPTLQRKLHAGVDTVSWVLNAYNIVFAVLLVSMGRLADQFGRRRFFLIGMSLFTLGSLLCALSPTIHALIAFRAVQAIGAAVLAPLALAITTLVFPPKQRGLGLALIAAVANLAGAIGPPLGGVLVDVASWHWIFLINVPIGIVGVILGLRVMPETFDPHANRRVDVIGMVSLGLAVFALTYGLVEANSKGWGSVEIVGLFVSAGLLTVVFALSQRYGRYPMLTKALVRNGQFMGSSGSFVLFAMGVMGPLFLCAIAFVNMWGYSQLDAALAISPIALAGLVVAPLVARVADRVQPRVIGVGALVTVSGGIFWLASIPATPHYTRILPALLLFGAGMGAAFPAINIGAMGAVSGQELGLGSGIVNMSRQLGFALGIAVLVAVFTGALDDRGPKAAARAAQVARTAGYPPGRELSLVSRAFANPNDRHYRRFQPRNGTERAVSALAGGAARDSFGDAFRVAALCELLAIPLALTMRRHPQMAQAAHAAAAAG
jgi:EmrB/QacA subfamily drug resistance transporter